MPSDIPPQVRKSFIFWLVAIAAGAFETALVIIMSLFGNVAEDASSIVIGVVMRVVIFAVMTVVIFKMAKGKNWARIVLAIGLGCLGTLSLLIGPIEWFSVGHSLAEAFVNLSWDSTLFMVSRIIHITAVLAGLVLMFTSAANYYFRKK